MKVLSLLEAIQQVADKAALLAQKIRSEETLFELLVEEKQGNEKNKRFVQDFKTLADVLVQELVKHHLSKEFPGIRESIYGEECNTFTNSHGEKVVVEIRNDKKHMLDLFVKVLDGNHKAAELLTEIVFSPCRIEKIQDTELEKLDVPVENVGLWIDPIDSTAQYINGFHCNQNKNGIHVEGLPCVVILIGAYEKSCGKSFLGLVNQPFFCQDETTKLWSSRCMWGVNYDSVHASSIPQPLSNNHQLTRLPKNSVILSTSESSHIKSELNTTNTLVYAAGAGYKLVCVADQLVGAYLLSKGTTFKWDTCGPQALLKSNGGNIINFAKAQEFVSLNWNAPLDVLVKGIENFEIIYNEPDDVKVIDGERWSNSAGILGYVEPEVAVHILKSTTEPKE